jgi:hypothetical protein
VSVISQYFDFETMVLHDLTVLRYLGLGGPPVNRPSGLLKTFFFIETEKNRDQFMLYKKPKISGVHRMGCTVYSCRTVEGPFSGKDFYEANMF